MINRKYGKWLCLSEAKCPSHITCLKKQKHKWFLCICECGVEKIVYGYHLTIGRSFSCGCSRLKHGFSGTNIYGTWTNLIGKCYSKKHPQYHSYGAKGFSVCKEWFDSMNFIEWAMKTHPGKKSSLNLINKSKKFSPKNCVWIDTKEKTYNTKTEKRIKNQINMLKSWLK